MHTAADSTELDWLLPSAPSRLRPFVAGPLLPPAVLERWCQEGMLHAVVDGLYLVATWSGAPAARCAALEVLLRTDAVVGMASAVWARGGPGRRPPTPDERRGGPDRDGHEIDLLVPPRNGRSWQRDGVRTRRLAVRDDEVEQLLGVPVTTPVRTAADLVVWGSDRDQEALDWLWRRGTEPAAVRAELVGRTSTRWNARGLQVLRAVEAGTPAPLRTLPLVDPVTTWSRARDLNPRACP